MTRRVLRMLAAIVVSVGLVVLGALGYGAVRVFGPLSDPTLDWIAMVEDAYDKGDCKRALWILVSAPSHYPDARYLLAHYDDHGCEPMPPWERDSINRQILEEKAEQEERLAMSPIESVIATLKRFGKTVALHRVLGHHYWQHARTFEEKRASLDLFWIKMTCALRLDSGAAARYYELRYLLMRNFDEPQWLLDDWERLRRRCAAMNLDLAKRFEAIAEAKPPAEQGVWWWGFSNTLITARILGSEAAKAAYSDAELFAAQEKAEL